MLGILNFRTLIPKTHQVAILSRFTGPERILNNFAGYEAPVRALNV
jgi:hypothetical protein